jgi:hypothetical protein
MSADPATINDVAPKTMVPTGTQALSTLTLRRAVFGALVIASVALLTIWLAHILAADGFSILDAFLVVAFAIGVPWTVIGFWNSLIGFTVIHGTGDLTAATIPLATRSRADDPIFTRTAILMTLRNEDPTRAFRRLKTIKASLDATGEGDHFDYFVLSDSSRPEVIAAEEWEMELWRRQVPEPGRADPEALPPQCRLIYVQANAGWINHSATRHTFCQRTSCQLWNDRCTMALVADGSRPGRFVERREVAFAAGIHAIPHSLRRGT